MKRNGLLMVVIALVLSAFLCACAKEVEENIAGTSNTQGTNPTSESVQWEPVPEDATVQPAAGTEESTQPVSPETKPGVETEQTKPSEPSAPSESAKPDDTHKQLTFAEYLTLDAAGRQAYVESFPSMEEAMLWYESAKKAYDESKDTIDISGGSIDLGDIIDGMGK